MTKISIGNYIKKMEKIQEALISFLENENTDENFIELKYLIKNTKIHQNQHKFKSFLHLLMKISNNHHRLNFFFEKIEKILEFFQNDIKQYFTNFEIFNIFKSNKRILLFLFEQSIIKMDKQIVKRLITDKYIKYKYPQYFLPEIRPFINEEWFLRYVKNNIVTSPEQFLEEIRKELPENFYENRKKGEKDSYICELIRNDSVVEFIKYLNENKKSVDSIIDDISLSLYETNPFLLKNANISLIEYAIFFGSIQIIRNLKYSKVELKSSFWIYAIHSQNADLIHFLEENNVQMPDFSSILIECIKCHHIEFANYFKENYLQDGNINDILINCLKYYNFTSIQKNQITRSLFFYYCKYDYYLFVKYLFNKIHIEINKSNTLLTILIISIYKIHIFYI